MIIIIQGGNDHDVCLAFFLTMMWGHGHATLIHTYLVCVGITDVDYAGVGTRDVRRGDGDGRRSSNQIKSACHPLTLTRFARSFVQSISQLLIRVNPSVNLSSQVHVQVIFMSQALKKEQENSEGKGSRST